MGVISEKKFIKGMDVSSLLELEGMGMKGMRWRFFRNMAPMPYGFVYGIIPILRTGSLTEQGQMTWKQPWNWQGGQKSVG